MKPEPDYSHMRTAHLDPLRAKDPDEPLTQKEFRDLLKRADSGDKDALLLFIEYTRREDITHDFLRNATFRGMAASAHPKQNRPGSRRLFFKELDRIAREVSGIEANVLDYLAGDVAALNYGATLLAHQNLNEKRFEDAGAVEIDAATKTVVRTSNAFNDSLETTARLDCLFHAARSRAYRRIGGVKKVTNDIEEFELADENVCEYDPPNLPQGITTEENM